MNKYICIASLLLFGMIETRAQEPGPSSYSMNGIFAELILLRPDFSDGFVSLNYERALGKKKKFNIRAGVLPDFETTVSFPFSFHWITGPGRAHHFEYGIGGIFRIEHYIDTYNPSQTREWFFDFPAILIPLMYRYQKSGGLYLRGGINLYISWPTLPSPSFSIGYRF